MGVVQPPPVVQTEAVEAEVRREDGLRPGMPRGREGFWIRENLPAGGTVKKARQRRGEGGAWRTWRCGCILPGNHGFMAPRAARVSSPVRVRVRVRTRIGEILPSLQ
jgi:hypothetical protein